MTSAPPHDLERMFRPRSIALIGASDRSPWSHNIFGNFARIASEVRVHLVNRNGTPAHGQPAVSSATSLPEIPDVAYIFVPRSAVRDALADAAAAGINHALILSSGFAETGIDGALLEHELLDIARAANVRLLGPNTLGFINYVDRIPLAAFIANPEILVGDVAIVSQSGATATVLSGFATQQGVGLSHVIATGNEVDVDAADVIDFLVADPGTRAIALFAETIKRPQQFRDGARRASAAGKPIVVLKVGKSELATRLAQAHTGSLTGDDRVFDAVCRQEGIMRVDTPEALIVTAGLAARIGKIDGGVAMISISGGACEIAADRAEAAGLPLAAFGAETQAALAACMPDFGSVFNPLDVTGAAIAEPALFERVLKILARDAAIGLTACIYDLPSAESDPVRPAVLTAIGAGLAASATGIQINQTLRPITSRSRALLDEHGIPAVIGGLDHAISALAAIARWSRTPVSPVATTEVARDFDARPSSECETLTFLARLGVSVVPFALARDPNQAVSVAQSFGDRVVLKVSSPDILHKSDVGGVKLGLQGDDAIGHAFTEIVASARAAVPAASIDGCLVMPMRTGGVEMFVGVAQSAWGPVLAVGFGGIWIEALDDVSHRLLPVGPVDVAEMLGELRGRRLLDGYRGSDAIDLPALIAAVVGIGDAALALGPDLVSLEINPLRASAHGAECLDALAVWDD